MPDTMTRTVKQSTPQPKSETPPKAERPKPTLAQWEEAMKRNLHSGTGITSRVTAL